MPTDHDAALVLADSLHRLREIDEETFEWGLPYHLEQERDRATARVKAAVRHLTTSEETR